jgi:hypothetical protein
MAVLQWIADGCPEGVWPDDSHKVSARALEIRNLAVVTRGQGRWHAGMKSDGVFYLEHGDYPEPESAPNPDRGVVASSPPRSPHRGISAGDLIARLQSSPERVVRIEDPSDQLRAAYRSAIHEILAGHLAPAESALRHTGRDSGDLVIRLVVDAGKPMKPPLSVPESHDDRQPAIAALLLESARLKVSATAQRRALRLIQALADEADRRGYRACSTTEPGASFQIEIDEDVFAFALNEEQDVVEQISDDDVAAAKYGWQRVSPKQTLVPSGRLRLELLRGWTHSKWADRKRWKLDDKLGAVLAEIEEISQREQDKRAAARAEQQRRLDLWQISAPRARERFLTELNQHRLDEQVRRWKQAEDIRRYCGQVETMIGDLDEHTARRIREWLAWACRRADSVDPALNLNELQMVEPAEISDRDLDEYMPEGMTVSHPPSPGR